MTTATVKIGLNRGRRRIWMDGKRLADAGFVGGAHYMCGVKPGAIDMALDPKRLPNGRQRKVTGRPDGKPIIDIVGGDVETAFPSGTHVTVHFGLGRIRIRPAERLQQAA